MHQITLDHDRLPKKTREEVFLKEMNQVVSASGGRQMGVHGPETLNLRLAVIPLLKIFLALR